MIGTSPTRKAGLKHFTLLYTIFVKILVIERFSEQRTFFFKPFSTCGFSNIAFS